MQYRTREVEQVRPRRAATYDCDVLVIGGGIVGLSTAYAVSRAAPGTRVTVLEK
ncbi:FAD-dependent oxidoreductase, partial [Streptomyces sp. TRM76130]|nr:FAD-dependent oxidoreductase [Streptomyces sp. TRM76130]